VAAATGAYRPLHVQVRQVQLDIAEREIESRDLSTDLSRLRGEGPAVSARRTQIEERLDRIKEEIEALRRQIPDNWEADHKAFVALQTAEKAARAKYRRNVDDAYAPIKELLETIEGAGRLAGAKPAVEDLRGAIASATPDEAGERISEASRLVATAEGTGDIRKALSVARSAIKNRTSDAPEALRQIDEAIRLIEAELAWRQRASAELLVGLRRYDDAIRSTIGLRSLPRLPREQALDVAVCQSHHRDLSLGF
jgi:chromosome segregation ATPase